MKSIHYYNQNSKAFIENTQKADMSNLWDAFEKYLKPNSLILDAGCGSGRDSYYFLSKGYSVLAFDGSMEMVKHCKRFLHDNVIHATFEDFDTDIKFDGIWACASFIHVEEENLVKMIKKFSKFLKDEGIIFMSFKEREENYEKNGRYFTCLTEIKFKEMVKELDNIDTLEIIHTVDVREGREDEKWISVIMKVMPMLRT